MNQLNPVEAVAGAQFKLLVTVTGNESGYICPRMYIDNNLVFYTESTTSGVISNGVITFSTDKFDKANAGDHTYSVTLANSAGSDVGTNDAPDEQVVIYKNALKVYSSVTSS